jgi:AcrR family transcriptional regulator
MDADMSAVRLLHHKGHAAKVIDMAVRHDDAVNIGDFQRFAEILFNCPEAIKQILVANAYAGAAINERGCSCIQYHIAVTDESVRENQHRDAVNVCAAVGNKALNRRKGGHKKPRIFNEKILAILPPNIWGVQQTTLMILFDQMCVIGQSVKKDAMQEVTEQKQTSQNEERAERILDAALKLLLHYGYDKTTVSDIAKEANVSKGAIYLHYASREALFEALIMREVMRYGEGWMALMDSDPEGGTFVSLYRHALVVINDFPLIRALYARDQRILGDFLRQMDPKFHLQNYHFRTEFIRQMQEVGAIRTDIEPQAGAYILAMLSQGFFMIDDIVPREIAPPADTVIQTMALMLTSALAPEGGGDSEAGKRVVHQIMNQLRNWGKDAQTE